MNLETRKQEIVSSIKSGSKTTYHRSEVLPELLALQQEIVTMTFNQEHADLADLKIWDVERHLVQMNEECEGVASEELVHFQSGCRQLTNLIKAEISGNWGETKAFSALDRVCAEYAIRRGLIPAFIRENKWACTADMSAYLMAPRNLKGACKELLGLEVSKEVRASLDGKHDWELSPEHYRALVESVKAFASSMPVTTCGSSTASSGPTWRGASQS